MVRGAEPQEVEAQERTLASIHAVTLDCPPVSPDGWKVTSTQSLSVMPTARSMARAGARSIPSVTSWLRGFMSSVMG